MISNQQSSTLTAWPPSSQTCCNASFFPKCQCHKLPKHWTNPVAAGINMAVDTNNLPEAAYIVDCCERMDQQRQQSQNVHQRSKTKPYKAVLTESTAISASGEKTSEWLQSWKIDCSHIQCVQGWILTGRGTQLFFFFFLWVCAARVSKSRV